MSLTSYFNMVRDRRAVLSLVILIRASASSAAGPALKDELDALV
jgi:hypothetical protein